MTNQNNNIKYFLYARKSSESEDKQVASIDAQIDELKKISKENNLEVVEILSESQSAKKPGRPVFNSMLERIYKGEATGVLCWKINRLARNPIDGGKVSWMLQEGTIKHIQTFGRSYYPSDNVLMMAVELGMANQFIKDLSVDTKRGLRAKAERGWYPTFTSLGYKHNPLKIKGEKEIVDDPEKFHLLRKMFDLMLTGHYPVKKILDIATNEWGLRNKKNKKVAISTFYRILSDPFYYGNFEYPQGSGNWYKGKHKPMITINEFERIQKLLGKETSARPHNKEFAFTGLMRCGECGAIITAEAKVKSYKNGNIHNYTYYHCTKRKNPNCSQKCIRVETLEKQISEEIKQIFLPKEFCSWALEVLSRETRENGQDRAQLISKHKKEYDAVVTKINGIIDMRSAGELTAEEFNERKIELSREKEKLQELLKDVEENENNYTEKANSLFLFAEKICEKFINGDLKDKGIILSCLGSNLTLINGKLEISLQKPLIHIKNLSQNLHAKNEALEPMKNGEYKRKTGSFESAFPMLLPGWDSNPRPIDYTYPLVS
ncbi:MAG TPA: recombinase family protein [bacterium]|nr:recombinase family protein [bacterium]